MQEQFQTIEKKRREKQFDGIAKSALRKYDKLMREPVTQSLVTIRDKVVAHAEITIDSEGRRLSVAGDYPIEYPSLFQVVNKIGDLTKKIELLFNGTTFDLKDSRKMHREDAVRFWL